MGLLVSPIARSIALPKLYTILGTMPMKYILKYRAARGSTSAGVSISSSIPSVKRTPTPVSSSPPSTDRSIEVCTLFLSSSSRFAPKCLATITLAPTESPIKRLIRRLMSEPVQPTAAKASSPANFPTTTTSAALNSSCRMLESIRGTANLSIFGNICPSHIFIVYTLFCFNSKSPAIRTVRKYDAYDIWTAFTSLPSLSKSTLPFLVL